MVDQSSLEKNSQKKLLHQMIFLLASIVAYLVVTIVVVYFMNLKSGYHIDEIYSHGLANNHFVPFLRNQGEWLDSSIFTHYLTVQETQTFRYDSVFYNQSVDVHPPLFYVLLHTISSFFPNVFSKWFGLSINLVFYLGTLVALQHQLFKVTKNKWVALIGMLFFGLSLGAISNALFIRMYMMQTFFTICLLNSTLTWINPNKITTKAVFLHILVLILGSLTHYYFFIYAFLLVATLSIVYLIRRKWKMMWLFGAISLLGILVSYLMFPAMVEQLISSDRGVQSSDGLTWNIENYIKYLNIIAEQLFSGYLLVYVLLIFATLVFLVYGLLKIKKSGNKSYFQLNKLIDLIIIFIPVYLSLTVIQLVAPYQTDRYVFYLMPIIVSSSVVFIFQVFKNQGKSVYTPIILLVVTLFISVAGLKNEKPGYLYRHVNEIMEIVEEHKAEDVLMINHEIWRMHDYIYELLTFEKGIYPLVVNEASPDLFPEDERISNSQNLFVYIDTKLDQEKILKILKNKYGFSKSEQLYRRSYGFAYELSK